jgi:hypothetical protein
MVIINSCNGYAVLDLQKEALTWSKHCEKRDYLIQGRQDSERQRNLRVRDLTVKDVEFFVFA